MTNGIDKLSSLFNKFPGIGPRQAKRFAYFLLNENDGYVRDLTDTILRLKKETARCRECFRLAGEMREDICRTCFDPERNNAELMVVAKEIDFENINKMGVFGGKYFILGGNLPILEKEPEKRIRINELRALIEKKIKGGQLREVILALSANPEGDNTAEFLKNVLTPICGPASVKITLLGRGLSTGTELEYSDADTVKNALRNRA